MRSLALAGVAALATVACALPPPASPAADEKPGYNRRELEPRPGLFTGPDGEWTVYRNGSPKPAPKPSAEAAPPPVRETLLCARGQVCDPPLEAE